MSHNATKVLAGISCASATLAIGLVILAQSKIRQAEAMLESNNTPTEAQIQPIEERLRKLEALAAALPTSSSAAAELAAAERSRQLEAARARSQQARALAQTRQDVVFRPEVQELYFQHFKNGLPLRYRALYRNFGLSADQIREFESLLAERYWALSDYTAVRATSGAALHPDNSEELKHQLLAPIDESLRNLLGEEGYRHYVHNEGVAYLQPLVEGLAAKLFDSPQPLTARQADQVVDILAEHERGSHARTQGERWIESAVTGTPETASVATWMDIAWDAAAPRLQQVLTPGQFALLQTERERVDLRRKASTLRADLERELVQKHQGTP